MLLGLENAQRKVKASGNVQLFSREPRVRAESWEITKSGMRQPHLNVGWRLKRRGGGGDVYKD